MAAAIDRPMGNYLLHLVPGEPWRARSDGYCEAGKSRGRTGSATCQHLREAGG
jgi:hypothetical protein